MTTSPLPRRPLSAGSEIDAWCTRCKMDLGHRIVAMVGTAPKRVLCMTCGSEHNYREPKAAVSTAVAGKRTKASTSAAKSPKSPKKAGAAGSRAAVSREEWERRVRSGQPLTRYTISDTFEVDQLITHKKFGDGYVNAVIGDKVSVVFVDGERTLVHGLMD